MKFKLKPHPVGPNAFRTAPHVHSDGHTYEAGEVLECDKDLRKLFPSKFDRVSDAAKVTVKKAVVEVVVEEPEFTEAEESTPLVNQEDQPVAKAKAPAKAQPETVESASEDEDCTSKFPAAVEGDLTVIKTKDGFVVKDGSRVLSKEPLAKATDVKKWLKANVEADDEE